MRTLEKRGLSEGMRGVYGGETASRTKASAEVREASIRGEVGGFKMYDEGGPWVARYHRTNG